MDRHKEVRKTLYIVLVFNLLVTLLKAVFGVLANSLSMIADSVHSLFDSSSNIIGLVAINVSRKPPDKEHPYGHGKYETIATLIIASLLFLTAFEIVESVLRRVQTKEIPDITNITFAVMFVTLVINYFVSEYEHKKGKSMESEILIADSFHTKSDIFASISVIISFFAIRAGYSFSDPIVAFFIVLLIVRTGFKIIKDNSEILCDVCAIEPGAIAEVVTNFKEVKSCHNVRTRGSKTEVYLDLHIVLGSKKSLRKAHELSHDVEEKLKEEFKQIRDVVVHIEPER